MEQFTFEVVFNGGEVSTITIKTSSQALAWFELLSPRAGVTKQVRLVSGNE